MGLDVRTLFLTGLLPSEAQGRLWRSAATEARTSDALWFLARRAPGDIDRERGEHVALDLVDVHAVRQEDGPSMRILATVEVHQRGGLHRAAVRRDIGKDLDEEKANEAKRAAEEALKNAKSDIDLAKAQSELAVMAAQIAALRKYRQKK